MIIGVVIVGTLQRQRKISVLAVVQFIGRFIAIACNDGIAGAAAAIARVGIVIIGRNAGTSLARASSHRRTAIATRAMVARQSC